MVGAHYGLYCEYARLYLGALKSGYIASIVAKQFVNHVVKLHNFPRSIVSDSAHSL